LYCTDLSDHSSNYNDSTVLYFSHHFILFLTSFNNTSQLYRLYNEWDDEMNDELWSMWTDVIMVYFKILMVILHLYSKKTVTANLVPRFQNCKLSYIWTHFPVQCTDRSICVCTKLHNTPYISNLYIQTVVFRLHHQYWMLWFVRELQTKH
jgi:hypothetical protein